VCVCVSDEPERGTASVAVATRPLVAAAVNVEDEERSDDEIQSASSEESAGGGDEPRPIIIARDAVSSDKSHGTTYTL